jgi:hypothetical protein
VARVDDLTRRSQYVFQGAIRKLGASTMSLAAPRNRTAVVRVEKVLYAPETFDDFADRDITVELQSARGAKEGQRAVFFAASWIFGESLALVEVGRMPARNVGALEKQIDEAERKIVDDAVRTRLRRAQLVVVARVVSTEEAKERRRIPITEHAPEWWEAVLEVESAEKGRPPDRVVTILFPKSTDEVWIDSPKFERSEEGIWILQRNQKERGWPIMRVPGLTALDPLDFHSKRELPRIRELLETLK